MTRRIPPAAVRELLLAGGELALLDAREQGKIGPTLGEAVGPV